MKLSLHTFQLELNHPFKIARGTYTHRKILVIELQDDGYNGYGEAMEHDYYQVRIPELIDVMENLRSVIENYSFDTPEQFWEFMNPHLKKFPFAQCALDVAAHDLFGKKMKLPLYQLWGLSLDNIPITDYTIGIDTPENMVEKMKKKSWFNYKIKLGTDNDLEIIKTLRANTDVPFRIDANCGWTAKETIEKSKTLKHLGVEFIEQPMPVELDNEMNEVFEKSALPVFADESCRTESDVKKCVGKFHGINIKLTKCGGLTPARRMIHEAQQLGLKIMVGCMMESSIGISAIAHLLPLLDYVDMDSIFLIKNDIADGVKILDNGNVVFPNRNGIGCVLL